MLASDDLGQNWSAGRGIHLAKELLGSSVEINQNLSVYDLASTGRTFDVILFLGVYYHLHDPFYALAQIRHCCHPGTVVVVDGPVATALRGGEALHNYADRECEWLPTAEALRQMLRATYFADADAQYLDAPSVPGVPLGWRWRLGTAWAALRGARPAMLERLTRVVPQMRPLPNAHSRRLILTCTPHDGANELHSYRPPFGLHAYDPRFRDAPASRAA